jgi:hypothetical protein
VKSDRLVLNGMGSIGGGGCPPICKVVCKHLSRRLCQSERPRTNAKRMEGG